MRTQTFIKTYKPCYEGKSFAKQFEDMSEVWEKCQRPDWLFWILAEHAPLSKKQSVSLAIEFAEMVIDNWVDTKDNRPAFAIEAAKAWLANPTEENQKLADQAADAAAESAESAAESAAWSAWSAVRSAEAAWSAVRSARSAAWSARSAAWSAWAAEGAARSAEAEARSAESEARSAESEARSTQCNIIRLAIPNPFN